MNRYSGIVKKLSSKAKRLPEANFTLIGYNSSKDEFVEQEKFYYKPKNTRIPIAAAMIAVFMLIVGIGIDENNGFRKMFNAIFTPGIAQSGLNAVEMNIASSKDLSQLSDIPFTLGVYKNIYSKSYNSAPDFNAQVIRSMEELQAKYRAEGQTIDYIQKYNNYYFDNNAIVFIVRKHNSGSVRDKVNSISKYGNQLLVDYTTLSPTIKTGDLACWRILLEVKKSDVANVTQIIGKQHEETLPDGVYFKDNSLEYLGT